MVSVVQELGFITKATVKDLKKKHSNASIVSKIKVQKQNAPVLVPCMQCTSQKHNQQHHEQQHTRLCSGTCLPARMFPPPHALTGA